MNYVDQLFSEKLDGHSTTPSAGAWEKVEAGLSAGTTPLAWMRWAAVLIPALAAASLWYNYSSETPALAVQSPVSAPASPVVVEPVITGVPEPAAKATIASKKVARKNTVVPAVPAPMPDPEVVTILPETVALEDITIEPIEPAQPIAEVAETQQPIVLVYTLESAVTNTSVEGKPTSLERVVEFARTVKHSDPISDLRGWKDELLAMDLRKKSTKRN